MARGLEITLFMGSLIAVGILLFLTFVQIQAGEPIAAFLTVVILAMIGFPASRWRAIC
jgi:hypothetical protein